MVHNTSRSRLLSVNNNNMYGVNQIVA